MTLCRVEYLLFNNCNAVDVVIVEDNLHIKKHFMFIKIGP